MMIADDIDNLYEQVEQAESNSIDNYEQSDINYPKDPYTQERIYALRLSQTGHRQGFNETRWLTEEQIYAKGLTLKPNEQEKFVISDGYLMDGSSSDDIKFYNVEQLDKTSFQQLPLYEKPQPTWSLDPKMEQFIASQGVTILHNSKTTPIFNIENNVIHMPHPSQYPNADAYCNDLFHELGHSTELKLRDGVFLGSGLSETKTYAQEELVAEMTAMKMNKITNSQHDVNLNHQYLNVFMNRVASDYHGQRTALEIADKESDKAVDLLQNRALNHNSDKQLTQDNSNTPTNNKHDTEVRRGQENTQHTQASGNNLSVASNDIFAKARQSATKTLGSQVNIPNETGIQQGIKNSHHTPVGVNSLSTATNDGFAIARQSATKALESKQTLSNPKTIVQERIEGMGR